MDSRHLINFFNVRSALIEIVSLNIFRTGSYRMTVEVIQDRFL